MAKVIHRYNPKDRESRFPMYRSHSGKYVEYQELREALQKVHELREANALLHQENQRLKDALETRELFEKLLTNKGENNEQGTEASS